ncbi:MAG TPA: hypothetical protein VJR06_09385, partial [Nitrososphaerales archaeon]|nr:hypothetical protein [Nitrososphaerales archaeon]
MKRLVRNRAGSLLILLTLSISAFVAAIVVSVPAAQAQTYPLADYFTMDANNPTPALQAGWSTFQTSNVGSQAQVLNN